jgi:hypothetical protein
MFESAHRDHGLSDAIGLVGRHGRLPSSYPARTLTKHRHPDVMIVTHRFMLFGPVSAAGECQAAIAFAAA